jgi:hypothetical protein
MDVESSTISSLRYDADHSILDVELRNGAAYRYFAVPAHVFEDFRTAGSQGRYFIEHIRETYPYECVREKSH